jgi:hypothetical protein
MPKAIWRRCLPAQDIEITVIGADFEKEILRAVPLVEEFLDQIFVSVQPKANRSFVRYPSGIGFLSRKCNWS